MRRLAVLLVTMIAVLTPALPAAAITYGVPDGNEHPNVGGLVAPEPYPDGTSIYCSGTLIAPTVFLTAAHCGTEGERVLVTFDTAYQAGDPVYAGTFHADPLYNQSQSDPHDIAVVVLDSPVAGITPARLPEAGSLSGVSAGQPITAVGYGAYRVTMGAGGATFWYDDVRMRSTGSLNAVTKSWLRISQNPATGDGGACYGDSGGPNFLGTTDIVAAITITGDAVCRATNVAYRLDTESARAFLGQYVRLP
jgi:Trypsin